MDAVYSVTVTAPVNIATMKYWGKRDVALNLPTNSSISVTLSQKDLRTITSVVAAAGKYTSDQLYLNGQLVNVAENKRVTALLTKMRDLRVEVEKDAKAKGEDKVPLSRFPIRIVSENNFPTAAGLASSASGYAAMVYGLAKLYELPLSDSDLSVYARQGSGSACRSLFGGFVAWEMGSQADGLDSKAVQIADSSEWSDMQALVLVASADKKDTPSTQGMQLTVQTSELFNYRVNNVCPTRFEEMAKTIKSKNFEKFAQLTMQDSNQFHATCLDSTPPIFYMNDTSRACIRVVEQINALAGKTVAAYTFDAGPNCVIYYLKENENLVLGSLKFVLPNADGWQNRPHVQAFSSEQYDQRWFEAVANGIKGVICTEVGPGPAIVQTSLVDRHGDPIL